MNKEDNQLPKDRWVYRHPYLTGAITSLSTLAVVLFLNNTFTSSDKDPVVISISAEEKAKSDQAIGEALGSLAVESPSETEPTDKSSNTPKATQEAEALEQDAEVLTNVPISPIVGVRFNDGKQGKSQIEKMGWIDPREVTPVKNERDSISFEPKDWTETIDLVEAPVYDSEGDIVDFSQSLGIDEEGNLVGLDVEGVERDFAAALTFHTLSYGKDWYPNDIVLFNKKNKPSVELLTKKGLIVTFEMVEREKLNRIGEREVWNGFNSAITDTDVIAAGCAIKKQPDGSYSPTTKVSVTGFRRVDARLAA